MVGEVVYYVSELGRKLAEHLTVRHERDMERVGKIPPSIRHELALRRQGVERRAIVPVKLD